MLGALFFLLWRSFLQDRAIKVVVDSQSSTPRRINAGIPQGSVLGPTLFLVYTDDLPDGALSRIGIYADDTIAYSSIQTTLIGLR